jgi:hypothetical protein
VNPLENWLFKNKCLFLFLILGENWPKQYNPLIILIKINMRKILSLALSQSAIRPQGLTLEHAQLVDSMPPINPLNPIREGNYVLLSM